MNKKIIEIDKEKGVFQCTFADERWYALSSLNEAGLPVYRYIPSVTWIAGKYPKGTAFYRWLADKGWDESQAIKHSAGNRGSRVHKAIEQLIAGEEVRYDEQFKDGDGNITEMEVEDWIAIKSFADWVSEVKPKFLSSETVAINRTHNYAGTIDCIAEIGGKTYLIDWKTSQNLWEEYTLQLSAYAHADGIKVDGLAILQVGYTKNKKKWKFNIIEDKFDLFLHAKAIWENEHAKEAPKQIDLPLTIKI